MSNASEDLVPRWMDRARETLVEAELMADADHWNACVNRLYYACFYAVTALLLRHGMSSSRHSGVRSLFNRHFAKRRLVSDELADLYNDLFDSRLRGDYIGFVQYEEAQVRPWIPQVRRFVSRIEELLESF
jgi:uncharacterized protein (UPF0332 family)